MLRSLYSGISGMQANQTKMDVIGNNIANVGTTAFKSGRVRFQDMLSQNVSSALSPGTNEGGINPRQVGLGVQVAGIDTIMSQGMMQPTSRNLDVALDGDGFIIVGKGPIPADNTKGVTLSNNAVSNPNGMSMMYTRDGALTLDKDGNLLTSDGYRVMGYPVTDNAVTGATGNTNTSIVYGTNASGQSTVAMNFVNANSTKLSAYTASGTTANSALVPLVIPDSVTTTDNSTTPATTKTNRIQSFSIEKDGLVKAVLDDGRVSVLGQVAMASFKNPAGLTKTGKDLYTGSANSGVAAIRCGTGIPTGTTNVSDNSGGYGDMLQGMLEMSNVDLAQQFTDMIVTSRAFQANSKTITTGDEMLQDILNIKR